MHNEFIQGNQIADQSQFLPSCLVNGPLPASSKGPIADFVHSTQLFILFQQSVQFLSGSGMQDRQGQFRLSRLQLEVIPMFHNSA